MLKGNGADIAQHCVPAVSQPRISITLRKYALALLFAPLPTCCSLSSLYSMFAMTDRSAAFAEWATLMPSRSSRKRTEPRN